MKYFKNLLYKVKQDIISMFDYPDVNFYESELFDYDRYWKNKRKDSVSLLSSWQRKRANYILSVIDRESKVLDLGCGDGAILKYLKEVGDIDGVGVDVSSDILKKAKEVGVKVVKMDISKLENLNDLPEVDYILGLEFIEHIPNVEEFIFKIKKKAKKGLIFSFPNSGYYVYRLRLLFGRFPVQWALNPGEHLRFWTVKDVVWWVDKMGFNLDEIIVYEGLPFLNKIMPSVFGKGIIIRISNLNKL